MFKKSFEKSFKICPIYIAYCDKIKQNKNTPDE